MLPMKWTSAENTSRPVLWQRHGVSLTWLCLGSAALGQMLLDRQKILGAALGYGLAALLFILGYAPQDLAQEPEPAPASGAQEARVPKVGGPKRQLLWRGGLLVMAACLGALAFPRFSGNRFTLEGTLLWAAGLALLGLAAWSAERPERSPKTCQVSEGHLAITWTHLALLGMMLLGAFYRLYKLDLIPAEMGCDLPHNYNNIRLLLRHEFLIFFPSFPGREALFFYLAAPLAQWFGLSHLTIKLASALIGVATIPIAYLLGRELYNREVGLYAAFFLSISRWHIINNRVGFRSSTVPPLLMLMVYFLARALRSGRRRFYALAGLCLGLGLYTYNAFMIAPVLAVAIVGLDLLRTGGHDWRAKLSGMAWLGLVALFVLIPLGRYAYEEPQMYFYRAATRLTGIEAPLPKDLLGTLAGNTARALLMFNHRGDNVFINNVPFRRELGFVTATLFVLGLVYALWRWRREGNSAVLAMLGVMLLPTILSLAFPQEVPNAGRAIGALPAAVLLAAVALALVRQRCAQALAAQPARELRLLWQVDGATRLEWRGRWGNGGRYLGAVALAAALGVEAWAVYPFYFRDYVHHLPAHNYSISLELARAIDDFSDDGETYIKTQAYWYDGNAVRAQLRRTDQSWDHELEVLAPDRPPLAGPPAKFMIILHPADYAALSTLRAAFPRGLALEHYDYDGHIAFITFYGERTSP